MNTSLRRSNSGRKSMHSERRRWCSKKYAKASRLNWLRNRRSCNRRNWNKNPNYNPSINKYRHRMNNETSRVRSRRNLQGSIRVFMISSRRRIRGMSRMIIIYWIGMMMISDLIHLICFLRNLQTIRRRSCRRRRNRFNNRGNR